MKFIENVIETLNPTKALQRQSALKRLNMLKEMNVSNSGYSEGGASREKNSLKGFLGTSKNAIEDIDKNLYLLRQRSRLLYMTSPIAASAIKTNRTNVIGQGLKLKSRIDFSYLKMTPQEADKWEQNTEKEFNMWADSRFCDIKGIDNFYELQQIAFMGWLLNGDSFALVKHVTPKQNMPYTLRLQLIESDRVTTPESTASNGIVKELKNGNTIFNGVEVDKQGTIIAYHVSDKYSGTAEQRSWQRVEAYGSRTGVPNIIQMMDAERAEQYRGVPYLSIVIESIKQLTRYMEAEVMAAVLNGIFAVFIQTESGDDDINFDGTLDDDDKISDGSSYELGSGTINILKKGETVNPVDAKRPNVNFDGFVMAMIKYIGAALEIPYESLCKSFNSSYSASRAALLEAWKAYRMRRSWFAHDFCQPCYEIWLAEAVAIGRIKAPGFFSDPMVRNAWSHAEWNGPASGQVDPVKEVEAAQKRIDYGLSTRDRETTELTGGDFDRNIEQLFLESEKMRLLNPMKKNSEDANTN